MSIGTIEPLLTASDVAGLSDPKLQLMARAALAAGYVVDVRHIRYEFMIFANGKHFHPLTNWGQCVRLVVDTKQIFEIQRDGTICVYCYPAPPCAPVEERRSPTTDPEYYQQMCDAVVTNVAKGFPV